MIVALQQGRRDDVQATDAAVDGLPSCEGVRRSSNDEPTANQRRMGCGRSDELRACLCMEVIGLTPIVNEAWQGEMELAVHG